MNPEPACCERAVCGLRRPNRPSRREPVCNARSMVSRGAVGLVVIAGALALTGCTNGTPVPAETVSVTAPPIPVETVTAMATETTAPSVYVPEGEYSILLGEGATRDDAALATAFVELALDPSTVPDGLRFAADGVQLGIMTTIYATRAPSELRSRSAWQVGSEEDLLFERVGPFSALDTVSGWVTGQDPEAEDQFVTGVFEVAVGPHWGCPYAIDGVPAGLESARQVWLKPSGEWVSCAGGWFAVDLFVLDGEVAAITVELGSP